MKTSGQASTSINIQDFESQQIRHRPPLSKRINSIFLSQGSPKKPAAESKVPETVGNLVISAGMGAAAHAHPLFTTVRPMVVSGRVEHFR